jgi:hypothetical protein
VNESPLSSAAQGATPVQVPDLPEGWRNAEQEDWSDWSETGRRRSFVLRVTVAIVLAAALLGALVWVAAGHYARGVDALNDHAYARAMSELSAARLLVFPYRDARTLEERAEAALQAETAAHEAERRRVAGVVAGLGDAAARLDAGEAAAVLAALTAIKADDLRATLLASEAARKSARGLSEDLIVASEAALRQAGWVRAGRFAAALLLLEPSSPQASALAARASQGERLSAKLGEARDAASRGQWRAALRLALAVADVRKDFPGAATLIADARQALAPKPKPKPAVQTTTPAVAPAPVTGGTTTPVAPPQPPPP